MTKKNFFQRVDKLLTLQFVALVKILKTKRKNNYIFTNELKREDGVDDKKCYTDEMKNSPFLKRWSDQPFRNSMFEKHFDETMKHSL